MSRLWIRRIRVTLEGKAGKLVIENLTINFEVECTSGSSQNKGKVTLWNLSKAHRGQLGEEYDSVTVEAGYENGPFGIILKGDIRDVENKLDDGSADVSSIIEVGDGDKAVNKGSASKTFPKGTKPKEIAEHLAK